MSSDRSSDGAIGEHITVDEQVSESIDRRPAARTMLPKSYAQTSLDRRRDGGVTADRSRRSAADRVAGGAPTGRVDQGGPREVAARNGEALMRRRSVTTHRAIAHPPLDSPERSRRGPSAPVNAGGAARASRFAVTPSASDTRSVHAAIAGRTYRCEGRRPVAVDGSRGYDGHVGDELQAVVTWR